MLKEVLKHVKTVAIGGHVRPDGDCVGSCLGLYQYIKENYEEIQADVYLEDGLHPNADGYRMLGEVIAAEWKRILNGK